MSDAEKPALCDCDHEWMWHRDGGCRILRCLCNRTHEQRSSECEAIPALIARVRESEHERDELRAKIAKMHT